MKKIIYYVATSLDGYIAGPNEDISKFVAQGEGVQQYLADLQQFKTVIMGRSTYEFGYKFGLPAGQPAYPHMQHYIFSDKLSFEDAHEKVQVVKPEVNTIERIRESSETDIYLCGGGIFAGWLLENQLIDVLKLKINPVILGGGTPLFGKSNASVKGSVVETKLYSDGLQINTYQVKY